MQNTNIFSNEEDKKNDPQQTYSGTSVGEEELGSVPVNGVGRLTSVASSSAITEMMSPVSKMEPATWKYR